MMRRPVLAACGVTALCVAASVALLAGGRVGETFAIFDGETQNAGSVFADGWLNAPTGLTASVSGADVNLSWTPGSNPSASSQQLYWFDNGSSSSCGSPAYTATGSALAYDASSTTDSGRGSGSSNGHYVCYRLDAQIGSAWTASATAAAVRVGFFATALSVGNGNLSLAQGDTFSVTFNQTPATPSSTTLCTFTSGNTILVGDVGGCASTSDSSAFRLVSSQTISRNNTYSISWGVSGNVLTATISANVTTPTTVPSTPSWTFTAGNVGSATGSAGACTSSCPSVSSSGGF